MISPQNHENSEGLENGKNGTGPEEECHLMKNSTLDDFVKEFQDFEVYDDDVWLITTPKSGTHWMQETLCCLLHGMDFEKLKSPSYKRAYNMEFAALEAFRNLQFQNLNDMKEYSATLERPRVLKTHIAWENLPKQLRDPDCKAKIIFLTRNPKDVFVSWYHYTQMVPAERAFEEKTKTIEMFADLFLQDNLIFLPYWDQVFKFWKRRDSPKILFLKYEEMKKNFPKVLDKLTEFLGLKPLTQQQKEAVTNYLSFDNMKKNNTVMDFMHCHGKVYRNTYANTGEKASFMRKGKVGGWKQELSPELVERFDEWILKNTAGTGYSTDAD